jgi:1,2-diacylglycerol 3-alpha-glucosyltransferase
MNIGIFTDTFEPVTNGVVDAVWRVCKGFQKEGHKVHLFALSDCNKDYVSKGVHIHKFKGKSFKFYPDFYIRLRLPLRRVMRIVKKEKIEVLHSNVNLCMGVCALIISIFKKIPLITTFHTMVPEFIECFIKSWDNNTTDKPTLIKVLEKLKLRKPVLWLARKFVWYWMRYFNTSEWLTVPSNYTKKVLIEHGLSKEKIIVVPNPIETGKNKKINKDKNMILHVGRLSPEKNIDLLIKSLKYIKHDYNVVITSDGPQMDYLKELAAKEGVKDRVKFTGFVSKETLDEYYDKAELFVSAAVYDTFNNCVAEALAHGVPVIINKDSGATDFVNHGKNGLILKNNDPKEYAKNIDWVLFNKEVKKALSKAGEKIREYTSIDNIIQKIESLYKKMNKSSKLKKLKDLVVYSAGAVFAYGIIITGNLFQRK